MLKGNIMVDSDYDDDEEEINNEPQVLLWENKLPCISHFSHQDNHFVATHILGRKTKYSLSKLYDQSNIIFTQLEGRTKNSFSKLYHQSA